MKRSTPTDFSWRVETAARFIASGRPTNRRFDGCFECFDGDAVATALYRRTRRRPDTKLARNLWRYLHRPTVIPIVWANRHRSNFQAWSDDLTALGDRERARLRDSA